MSRFHFFLLLILLCLPSLSFSAEASYSIQNFTAHWASIVAIAIFGFAYLLVIFEEQLHLRKSKPVLIAVGIIWLIVALVYKAHGDIHTPEILVRHNLLEFAELFLFLFLFLFLLVAMTFINTMHERGIFDWLRTLLPKRGYSLRGIFWATGIVSFCLSPIADNLTTALLMATVVMAVGGDNIKFVSISCVNIVVAANAGGAFSPFGDITTLMIWQKGIIQFQEFFVLFLPSLVNWLVPAVILSMFLSKQQPQGIVEEVKLRHGAWFVVILFVVTIGMAVSAHNFLHLPPVLGMMMGLGLLKVFGYYLKKRDHANLKGEASEELEDEALEIETSDSRSCRVGEHYNIFKSVERAEWGTLMFFYGVIL
mgnify:CR=1 FL=1